MSVTQEHAVAVSDYGATLRCRACSIFIGAGHVELEAQVVMGEVGRFCVACCRRLLRRTDEERAVLAAGRPLGAPDRERQPILVVPLVTLG